MSCRSLVVSFWIAVSVSGTALYGQAFNDFDLAPHNYYSNERRDPMTQLLEQLGEDEETLGSERGLPLLKALLAKLDIPESSQVLVFSQTSLQRNLINPSNPRALFFNEETHVAWMPGGKIEVISFDADSGGRFYIEDAVKDESRPVTFTNPRSCFGCHGGAATNFLPGPLGRSHLTSAAGRRLRAVPGHDRISHAVPFPDRWGGYFVTGAPKTLPHLGNAFAERKDGQLQIDSASHRSKEDLTEFLDPRKYPRATSNIVPLLLFDHQVEAHNLIMEARHRDRQFDYEHAKFDGAVTGKTRKDTEKFFDRFVRYLLFADEASLQGHVLRRSTQFETDFRRNRMMDSKGRSLKDFDLENRMFEHRLSYMIQSPTFTGAPSSMKNRVYDRLWAILSPEIAPEGFAYFEEGERTAIIEILLETQSGLPAYWKQ